MKLNKVFIAGRIAFMDKLAEKGKTKWIRWTLAVEDDVVKKKVHFIPIVSFSPNAEYVSKSLKVGDGVLVQGRIDFQKERISELKKFEIISSQIDVFNRIKENKNQIHPNNQDTDECKEIYSDMFLVEE